MPPLGLSLPPNPLGNPGSVCESKGPFTCTISVTVTVKFTLTDRMGSEPNLSHQMVCHHWYKRICILDGLHTKCHRNSGEVLNVPQQKVSSMKFKFCSDSPPHPWHTLRIDLFYYNKMDFLVVVDYFSKFLIARMNILIQKSDNWCHQVSFDINNCHWTCHVNSWPHIGLYIMLLRSVHT